MNKADLIALLASLPDQAEVLIDVKPWDEALNLTGVDRVEVYGMDGTAAERAEAEKNGAGPPFATITPSTEGATRLDPAAD